MANAHFDLLNDFVGFGNPDAPLWFFGIEDGGAGWVDDEHTRRVLATAYSRTVLPLTLQTIMESSWPVRDGRRRKGTSIYYYMSHVVIGLLKPPGVRSARDIFPELGDHVFHVNMFPLAKPRSRYGLPEQYRTLFDLDPADIAAYRATVRERRFPMLRTHWNERRARGPLVTVCFGIGPEHMNDVAALFGLDPSSAKPMGRLLHLPTAQLFVTPFFGQCGRSLGALRYADLDPMIEWMGQYLRTPAAT